MATIIPRKTKEGATSYRVQIRMKGYKSASASFERLTDAKRWAQATEAAMRERRYFKTSEAKNKTLKELIFRYLKKIEKENPKRHVDLVPMLSWWDEELGHMYLADITKAKITEKIEKLSRRRKSHPSDPVKLATVTKTLSPARVNRYVTALSHCFTIAVDDWEWMENNPIAKISKQKEPRGIVRFLDEQERNALLGACKNSSYSPLYLIVVLALSTGARKSELLNLRWPDIDLKKQQIILHETKNGERRVLPLRGHAFELIKDYQKVRLLNTDLLFPFGTPPKPYEIRPPFEKAVKEAGIKNFRFHDLRHTAASYLAMNGASLMEISEILGHKTLQMVKRYAHLAEAHTHDIVERMNTNMFGQTNNG